MGKKRKKYTIQQNLWYAKTVVNGNLLGVERKKPAIYFTDYNDPISVCFYFPDCCYDSPDDIAEGKVQIGTPKLLVRIKQTKYDKTLLRAAKQIRIEYKPLLRDLRVKLNRAGII